MNQTKTVKMDLHYCDISKQDTEITHHGIAVFLCEETEDGRLWITNMEYGNGVNYCPFCGFKAKVPMGSGREFGAIWAENEAIKRKCKLIDDISKFPFALGLEKGWSKNDEEDNDKWIKRKMLNQPESELQEFLDELKS